MTISKTTLESSKQRTSMSLGTAYLSNRKTGRNIVLKHGVRSMGRKKADLLIAGDPMVSREHCRFHLQNLGLCYVEDLGSTNKTFVNSSAIPAHSMVLLKEGDTVQVGRQLFEYRNGAPEKMMAPKKRVVKRQSGAIERVIAALQKISLLAKN